MVLVFWVCHIHRRAFEFLSYGEWYNCYQEIEEFVSGVTSKKDCAVHSFITENVQILVAILYLW